MPLGHLGYKNANSSTLLTDWLLDTSLSIIQVPNLTNSYYFKRNDRLLKVLKIINEKVRENLCLSLCDSMYTILAVLETKSISKLERTYRCRVTQTVNLAELMIYEGQFEMWSRIKVFQEGFGNLFPNDSDSPFCCKFLVLRIWDCDIIERESNAIELGRIPLLYYNSQYQSRVVDRNMTKEGEPFDIQSKSESLDDELCEMDPF